MADLTRRALLASSAALGVTAFLPVPATTKAVVVMPNVSLEEFLSARMAEKMSAFAAEEENRLLYGIDLSTTPDVTALAEFGIMPGMHGVTLHRVWRDGQLVFDSGVR